MKSLSKLFLMVGVLTLICTLSALSLAFVFSKTSPIIAEQIKLELQKSLKIAMPDADRFEEIKQDTKWTAYKNNEIIGTVLKSTATGYSSQIQIIFGMDNDKKITKVIIVDQNETPGLGTKIKDKKFINQFTDKNQSQVILKKDSQVGEIDAITAATISSRAVVNAINKSMNE